MKYPQISKDDAGYALIAVIILSALSIIITAAALQLANSHSRTTYNTKVRTEEFYDVEAGVNRALSWLRENSQKLVIPYRRDNFYSEFAFTAPSVGALDISDHTIPTLVKTVGSGASISLTNDATLVTAEFPPTEDIVTGAAFDAETDFANQDFGNAKVRITLVNAIAFDPDKDYGPPPADTPDTDFYPVYRIDSMSDQDDGAHVHGIITGKVIHVFDYGIYGEDSLILRQECDSYDSADGAYNAATNRNANCHAASNATAAIHKSEVVYGTLHTNGNITEENPYGGDVCADFTANCPNKGETCSGEDCGVPLLEQYETFDEVCTSEQAALNVNANMMIESLSDDPAQKCWSTITISANKVLTLKWTGFPYYIRELNIGGGTAGIKVDLPAASNDYVEVFVNKFTGDKLNASSTINMSGRPSQLRMVYLGTTDLVLNGNASFSMAFVAPNAGVTLSGNGTYFGALLAKRLSLTGNGKIHYDESLGGEGPIIDAQYRLREMVQSYR